MKKLFLYELNYRDSVAWIDFEGMLHMGTEKLPGILFADVPVMLHLTCGIMLSPMRYANNNTGPEGAYEKQRG